MAKRRYGSGPARCEFLCRNPKFPGSKLFQNISSFLPSNAVLYLEDLDHQQEHGHVMAISANPQMCRQFIPVVYANF